MRILQVSEFIEAVNIVLREAWAGEEVGVEGEISGYRVSQGQWVTFDLKDDKGLVNVFMPLWNLRVPIEDGLKVRVIGAPRVYPKYGKFFLSAERIELIGEGALRKALALLRARLEKEGLFDPTRKRELPRFPQRIALIASRESAAYGDFIRILDERWGGLEIDLYHVLVQGERAPRDIVTAIAQAQTGSYDVLVMTRGGGSLEELMAFNDEQVVRAIHASRIPTLVAIGHERDITLVEEAADVRGSTPTDCARRLVPDRRDVIYELASLTERMESSLTQILDQGHVLIERALHAPGIWLREWQLHVDECVARCGSAMTRAFEQARERLARDQRLLASLDPRAVLRRGYAIIQKPTGGSLTSLGQLHVGDDIRLLLRDGEAGAQITQLGKRPRQSSLPV